MVPRKLTVRTRGARVPSRTALPTDPVACYSVPPRLQLADFGFATVLTPPTYKVVEPVGSPGYAAPELLRLLPYDGQADVFSLGVIAFVLLSGASDSNALWLNFFGSAGVCWAGGSCPRGLVPRAVPAAANDSLVGWVIELCVGRRSDDHIFSIRDSIVR